LEAKDFVSPAIVRIALKEVEQDLADIDKQIDQLQEDASAAEGAEKESINQRIEMRLEGSDIAQPT